MVGSTSPTKKSITRRVSQSQVENESKKLLKTCFSYIQIGDVLYYKLTHDIESSIARNFLILIL